MRHNRAWSKFVTAGAPETTVIRANKYGAQVTTVDGIRFDSKKEARRYADLRLLLDTGAISCLELQPKYAITVLELVGDDPQLVDCGAYHADFRYVDEATGELVVEDVKTPVTRTTAYRLRKRLIEAIHGITIREV